MSTRADDKILGFEYQFYYFLLELIKMEKNDVVGFEVLDDVHIEQDQSLSLIQLKHTRQTNTNDKPINLTTSDIDLWKTLSNWTDFINKQSDKNAFIEQTKFIFITNKANNTNHIFLDALEEFKEKSNIDTFEQQIITYKQTLKLDNPNLKYIDNFLTLDNSLLHKFIINLEFVFDLDNIIDAIKQKIKYSKSIKPNRVDKVFHELTGLLKEDFFNIVKQKGNYQYTGESFYLKTVPIFHNAQTDRLPFNLEIKHHMSNTIFEQTFAKQLSDINFNKEQIFEADYYRLAMQTNLNEFIQNNVITGYDKDILDRNTIISWKEEFDDIYFFHRNNDVKNAQRLYQKVLKKDLDLAGQKIEWKEATKGQYILMSDIPSIGWFYNWKEKYINEK